MEQLFLFMWCGEAGEEKEGDYWREALQGRREGGSTLPGAPLLLTCY